MMFGIAATVLGAWMVAGVPWAANSFAQEAAKEVTKEAINIHVVSLDHADIGPLEIAAAKTNAELGAMKEQLTRVERSVERLIDMQLD